MEEDQEFIEMVYYIYGEDFFVSFENRYKVYDIYNIIYNYINIDSVEIIYNKIIKILYPDTIYIEIGYKENILLNKILSYLKIVEKFNIKSSKDELTLQLNYDIFKTITDETYNELKLYKNELNISCKETYNFLWNKFLCPTNEKIIERKIEYYIISLDEENLTKTNKIIIDDYVNFLISKINIRKIKNYKQNINKPTLFFALLTNIFISDR